VFESGDWEIDLSRRELRMRNIPVPLGSRAFELVEVLVQSAGKLVTKDELMDCVWMGAAVGENTLHVHISAVRKALGPDRGMLRTASGRGYRLVGDWKIRRESPSREAMSAVPVDLEAARKSVGPFQTNLPVATYALIGRAPALQHLPELLSAYRAVTLTGPGGIGKTKLALNVARHMFPTFEGDAWLVELVALSDPRLLPTAIAGALGLKSGGDEITAESVARSIGDKKLLLVLDNCEHIIDAAARLVETIVRMCPRVSVLATSREVLRVDGEHVYRVPALQVPPEHQSEPRNILEHSAVQLFIARATAADSDFSPTGDDLPAIAALCRRLDGIPLAIEFAAARAATLGLQQIMARLDHRFELLTGGRRAALPRHQTLRATIDWSYGLLPEPERRLLRHLSIFPAGFTLEAAIAVMNDTGEDASVVVEGIANLVVKSLVTPDGPASAGRWRLLETIRAYAIEKLVESGEAEQAARRHAEFFRDFVAPAASGAQLKPTIEDMVGYGRELDNVRAALDWCFSRAGDPAIGVVLTAAYVPVWIHFAWMVDCRARTEQALANVQPEWNPAPQLRMRVYLALGLALGYTMGSVKKATTVLVEALELAEKLDDVDAQLRALWTLWPLRLNTGECRAAQSAAEQFSRVALRTGNPAIIPVADRMIGLALQYAGKTSEAQRCFERMLDRYVDPRDQPSAMGFLDQRLTVQTTLALVLCVRGFLDQGLEKAVASFEEARAKDHKHSLCEVLRIGCSVPLMAGDITAAERVVATLTETATSLNTPFWQVAGRCLQGKLLIKRGDFAAGSALLRSTLERWEIVGWAIWLPEFLGALAEGLAGLGQIAEALSTIDQALASAERGGELWYVAELLRIKGDLLLQDAGNRSIAAAADCFERCLAVAHEQGALFWELRGAMSLARLQIRQERQSDAREVLAPVYDKFTEGFETTDLRAARALLQSL
jgi:predicted ATPase/DNA-binding winged helix-turn-helix (wHTH) protein